MVVVVLWTTFWLAAWPGLCAAWADCTAAPCDRAASRPVKVVDVMAPLFMTNEDQWADFELRLGEACRMGVTAVSVDVWWGVVQAQRGVDDWRYYDRIVEVIRKHGLKWVPILSFHQCGGNVGDTCDIPIPPWIWQAMGEEHPGRNLRYVSEKGRTSEEYVSLWADDVVKSYYKAFMEKFVGHFHARPDDWAAIEAVDIGLGPAGELRYPSYALSDGWDYPHRGYFQAYSDDAQAAFRQEMVRQHGSLEEINNAWYKGQPDKFLGDLTAIRPPSDSSLDLGQAEAFVARRDYVVTAYGRDFVDWYNQALLAHGRRILDLAEAVFAGALPADVPFGVKVPGIHWQMDSDAAAPRIAEMTAGLVPASAVYDTDAAGHGYNALMAMLAAQAAGRRRLVLHFTCLERDNMVLDDGKKAHSLAHSLVFWVGRAAARAGVPLMGENARNDPLHTGHGWDNLQSVFCSADYTGLTVLRLDDVTGTQSGAGPDRYARFIECFAPPQPPDRCVQQ
jgi:hypothetical protein